MIAGQKSAEGIVGRRRQAEGPNVGWGGRTSTLVVAKRQKTQLELAFGTMVTGEARSVAQEGTEVGTAMSRPATAAASGPLMEAVVEPDHLRQALAQVGRNKGAPGVDGMTVDALAP